MGNKTEIAERKEIILAKAEEMFFSGGEVLTLAHISNDKSIFEGTFANGGKAEVSKQAILAYLRSMEEDGLIKYCAGAVLTPKMLDVMKREYPGRHSRIVLDICLKEVDEFVGNHLNEVFTVSGFVSSFDGMFPEIILYYALLKKISDKTCIVYPDNRIVFPDSENAAGSVSSKDDPAAFILSYIILELYKYTRVTFSKKDIAVRFRLFFSADRQCDSFRVEEILGKAEEKGYITVWKNKCYGYSMDIVLKQDILKSESADILTAIEVMYDIRRYLCKAESLKPLVDEYYDDRTFENSFEDCYSFLIENGDIICLEDGTVVPMVKYREQLDLIYTPDDEKLREIVRRMQMSDPKDKGTDYFDFINILIDVFGKEISDKRINNTRVSRIMKILESERLVSRENQTDFFYWYRTVDSVSVSPETVLKWVKSYGGISVSFDELLSEFRKVLSGIPYLRQSGESETRNRLRAVLNNAVRCEEISEENGRYSDYSVSRPAESGYTKEEWSGSGAQGGAAGEYIKTIEQLYSENGTAPSAAEVVDRLGDDEDIAELLIGKLIKKGRIREIEGCLYTEKMYSDRNTSFIVFLPVLGMAPCGTPEMYTEDPTNETMQFPGTMLSKDERQYYVLRASGDSMTGVGIYDNDYVVVERVTEANVGDIVVALVGGKGNTLKTLAVDKNGVLYLHPENEKYPDIYDDDICIQGKAIQVIRKLGH